MNELLTCQALLDFLDDYVEERLDASERKRFDEHLAVCPACVRYLQGYRGTLQMLTLAGREHDGVPEEVPRKLVEAILAARRAAAS